MAVLSVARINYLIVWQKSSDEQCIVIVCNVRVESDVGRDAEFTTAQPVFFSELKFWNMIRLICRRKLSLNFCVLSFMCDY
jgi:hypothetical protein